VVELGPGSGRADVLRQWLVETALPGVLAMPGIVGAHLGEADAAATTVKTDEKKLLQTPDAMSRWLVLVEGVDRDTVAHACRETLGDAAIRSAGADGAIERGEYQFGFAMTRSA
jgi:hypothetical protein